MREGVDELDAVGHLVGGQSPFAHEPPQGGGAQLGAAAQDDVGAAAFAEVVVGDGDDGDVVDRRVAEDDVLDLLGGDLLAAAVDLVLAASFDDEVAAAGEPDEVAGAVEAVRGEGARVVLGGPPVAADGVGAAGEQVSGLAGGDVAVGVVHDADLVVRADGPALGGDDGLLVVVQPGVVDQSFGHAEDLLQGAAEGGPDAAGGGLAELGAAHQQHPQAAEVVRGRGRRLGPHQGERRDEPGVGDAFAFDQRERGVRVGARAEHDPAARGQGAERTGRAEREVVRGGQGDEVDALLVDGADLVGGAHRVQVVVVGARDEFGYAGAAAGELEEGEVAGRGLVVRDGFAGHPGQRGVLSGVADDEHVPQGRGVGADPGGQVAVVVALVDVGDDVGDGLAEHAEVGDLGVAVGGQREDGQGADPEEREEHLEELGDVGQLEHDAVAAADPGGEQSGGRPVGAAVEFGVGPAASGAGRVDDGGAVGVAGGAGAQHLPEGLAAPVAGGAVALGVRGGPGGGVGRGGGSGGGRCGVR
ncbi:hypothetical protein CF54_07490, partial [Streptomyces sp. Tu 6176]